MLDTPLWIRFDDEATACPGCGSPRITLLDVITIQRDAQGRRIAFIAGCHGCGLLFANPMPRAEQLERYYADDGPWAASRAERTRKLERAHVRRQRTKARARRARPRDLLFDALRPYVPLHEPPAGAKALDFGCGDGKFLNRLQDAGWETYGIEPSSEVAFLRHHRLTEPPQDGSFDFAILHHVLEHVTDPSAVLRQLAGSLRDGAVLFVGVPRLDTLPAHHDLKYCIDGYRHLMCFSETCLTGLLARAGFTVVGHLHTPELDTALTQGIPLRLRLVARRTAVAAPRPEAPLQPAMAALRGYAGGRAGIAAHVRRWLPVRVRAALLDRAREKSKRRQPRRAA